jgi:SecD/SecF fusion protein
MQSRGAIKFFAILFALVCLFQLSFTFVTFRIESKAKTYAAKEAWAQQANELAKGDMVLEGYLLDSISRSRYNYFLDSMKNEVVYNILLRKYTYSETKDREINLGLDLKGGMNVTLEVSVGNIIRGLSGNSQNQTFLDAIDMAHEKMKTTSKDFVTLFAESIDEIDPNFSLASIFLFEFRDKGITPNSSNAEVIRMIRRETGDAFDRTYNILRTRIDRFGVTQPNIQKIAASNRILVELPGIKEPERVRKLLQGSAQLEFWETYRFSDIYQYFTDANRRLADMESQDDPLAELTPDEEPVVAAEDTELFADEDELAESITDTD